MPPEPSPRPVPEHPHNPETPTPPGDGTTLWDVTLSPTDPRTCPACTAAARVSVVMSRMGLSVERKTA